VHPFRPVLADCFARADSPAARVAAVFAAAPHRHHLERRICFDSGCIVSSRTLARLEEGLRPVSAEKHRTIWKVVARRG
jgi:hypothetical protein